MSDRIYRGIVKNVPNGFGFIGLDTVVQLDGSPHGIDTDDDIFIPQSECTVPLAVGLAVRFQMEPNTKKGDRHYKAVGATALDEEGLLPVEGQEVLPGFPIGQTTTLTVQGETPYVYPMKAVGAEDLAQVRANQPLDGVPPDGAVARLPEDEAELRRVLEGYLRMLFPGLAAIEVMNFSFTEGEFDEAALDVVINGHIQKYKKLKMEAKASQIAEEYLVFKETRRMIAWILEEGLLRPGSLASPTILQSMVKCVRGTDAGHAASKTSAAALECLKFMQNRGLVRSNTMLPDRHLVEMLCAQPVLYVACKDVKEQGMVEKALNMNSARSDEDNRTIDVSYIFLQQIGNRFPNQRWLDFLQIFNTRVRPISSYPGNGENLPDRVLDLVTAGLEYFDYVVIATPFTDEAPKLWGNLASKWVRSVDPFVLGFKNGVPFWFILARFSNNGVFPHFNECIADMLAFLRAHREDLRVFDTKPSYDNTRSPQWLQASGRHTILTVWRLDRDDDKKIGTHLQGFVDNLLRAFEAGIAFDWLRGEAELPERTLDGGQTPTGELEGGGDGTESAPHGSSEAEVLDPEDEGGERAIDVTPEGDGQ